MDDVSGISNLRVLVIDDDDIVREVLCETLRDAGCEVFDLPSPIGATRTIYENAIQAVVLDVMMPSINGDKLSRVLRQAARGKQLTIVLVSSCPLDELTRLADAAQADCVVAKGMAQKELSRSVARAHRQRCLLHSAPPRLARAKSI